MEWHRQRRGQPWGERPPTSRRTQSQFPARKVSEGAKLLEATAADDVCDLERNKRLLNGTQETVTVKEKIPTGASVEV